MADNLYSVDLAATNPTATKLTLPTAEQQQLENQLHAVNSVDGLVLISLRYGAELFLLNPSTRECKKLPVFPFFVRSSNRYHENIFCVRYDSSTDDYKVVTVSPALYPSGASIMAVYSLKTDSWKRIQDVNFFLVGSAGRVFVNGRLHGICSRKGSYEIVAFDLSDEVVRKFPQPDSYCQKGFEITSYGVAVLGVVSV